MDFPLTYIVNDYDTQVRRMFPDLGVRWNLPRDYTPPPTLLLCFTNRCGSKLLSDLLHGTGQLARADEFFNLNRIEKTLQLRKLSSYEQYCRIVIARQKQYNFFVGKVGWHQMYFMTKYTVMSRVFGTPRFVFARRRDVLDQAISFSIAAQTGSWSSNQMPKRGAEYNRDDIVKRLRAICEANAKIEEYLNFFGFDYKEVVYEDLIAAPHDTITSVTKWLGIRVNEVTCAPREMKQQTNQNSEWRKLFLKESSAHLKHVREQ